MEPWVASSLGDCDGPPPPPPLPGVDEECDEEWVCGGGNPELDPPGLVGMTIAPPCGTETEEPRDRDQNAASLSVSESMMSRAVFSVVTDRASSSASSRSRSRAFSSRNRASSREQDGHPSGVQQGAGAEEDMEGECYALERGRECERGRMAS